MLKEVFKIKGNWSFEDENEAEGIVRWYNKHGDILSINYFPVAPDIGAPLENLSSIRSFYREMARENGLAPIEIDTGKIKTLAAVKTIYKVRMEPKGFAYIGSYTIPFSDRSFVVKIQAVESGTTGTRESAVLLLEDCRETEEETGKIVDWEADPYDPNYKADFMANRADAEKYDKKFPDHPLSRVRSSLRYFAGSVSISRELYSLKPFVFGVSESDSKWWKPW